MDVETLAELSAFLESSFSDSPSAAFAVSLSEPSVSLVSAAVVVGDMVSVAAVVWVLVKSVLS